MVKVEGKGGTYVGLCVKREGKEVELMQNANGNMKRESDELFLEAAPA